MTPRSGELVHILIGAIVTIAVMVLAVAMFTRDDGYGGADFYALKARFTQVDGVSVGTDVYAAGVKVGEVTKLELDDEFFAIMTMRIDNRIRLDTDATAAVSTDGLFGEKFVSLDIGGADTFIKPGDEIYYTESALITEDLFDLIISVAQGAKDARKRAAPSAEDDFSLGVFD